MTKRILSLIVVFVSLFVIIALNCSGEATYDDGGGGGDTVQTATITFNVKIILDQSIDQVKGKTFADIDYVSVTSGPGTFDKVNSANNVPDFTNKFYKPSNFSYTESDGVATATVTASGIPLGARWVYFEAYEETASTTDKDITLSEQKYPDNFTINSETTALTADTTLDSVYGDVGINLQTNN
ncbi:MAG TPA: hypothetical protein PLG34_01650 [Spirochaetota bacterium]|jgi:hypothetical protein|nr:MAG: hypothetical protein BWX91_00919 [Spirochaetes bacterium ADurb.Bin133]HNZ25709.1 hypothetical protein [Spirochaetota bacterium]HPY86673.1 hypothetical protein [Spirochaetota bacterium]HQB62364.1 hypothetical protein [Spirochaetota bacterium]